MHGAFRKCIPILLAFVLLGCESGNKRVLLSFDNVITDVSLTLPAGTIGKGCEDGAAVGTACFQLRFDGLYRASIYDQDRYLRFYEDGRIMETSVDKPSTAKAVAPLFKFDGKRSGAYQVHGQNLSMGTSVEVVFCEYSGRIESDGTRLVLTRIVGAVGDKAEYLFTPVADLP